MSALEATLNGTDLFGEPITRKTNGPVAEKFGFPPFSVLDARAGEWQDRKRAWIGIGLDGECARKCEGSNAWHDLGLNPRKAESTQKIAAIGDGPTVFDPVVCECAYRWFCPEGGQVVDPFAGGSVRGIVAGMLGLRYWGCDLRKEQIDANNAQADEIAPSVRPSWVCGDSTDTLENAPAADFVFSCPPYGDLEKYSDDPADLSSMEWHTFVAAYKRIILRAVKRLRQDRFACFVVGDFRDKRGFYRDFVSTTIAAFRECGAELYNEAILVTSVGSASMRVTKQFEAGRKFAKTHQNVLVFCTGDWRKAADACK